jgi:hypothetical protein
MASFSRYAIYRDGQGYISTSAGGLEVDDYGTDVQPGSYYFVSESTLRFCAILGCLAQLLR